MFTDCLLFHDLEGHICYFQFGAIKDKFTMKFVFFHEYIFSFSLDTCPEITLLSCILFLYSAGKKPPNCFPEL